MIRISPGDLVAVEFEGRYYHALILGPISYFGGNFAFAFHASSDRPLAAQDLLAGGPQGFHAFVDFIWAKREGRLRRIARGVPTSAFQGPGRLKSTHAIKEKARFWFLSDMSRRELGRVERLTPEQAAYPLRERIDDTIMVDRIRARWTPAHDARI